MGYYIAEPHWGKGIMSEAVQQMCAFLFEHTDIVRVFAEPYAHNEASCRVLEKAGFNFEGILRQNALKNEQSVDMKMYAIIRDIKTPTADFKADELAEAHRSLLSMLNKCEKVLETERLILREMTLADLPAARDIVCDEQTMYAWNGAWSEEENLEGLEKQIRGYREDGFGRWAVVLKETGIVIGICGLQWCDTDQDKVLEIGYLFNRAYWHNGYAAEAAISCKQYAFNALGVDEVFSLVRDTNIASMNVAIRNGMLIRRRYTKNYKGEDMPHYVFSVKKGNANNA